MFFLDFRLDTVSTSIRVYSSRLHKAPLQPAARPPTRSCDHVSSQRNVQNPVGEGALIFLTMHSACYRIPYETHQVKRFGIAGLPSQTSAPTNPAPFNLRRKSRYNCAVLEQSPGIRFFRDGGEISADIEVHASGEHFYYFRLFAESRDLPF